MMIKIFPVLLSPSKYFYRLTVDIATPHNIACLDQVLAGGLVAEIVGEGDEALPLARAHHVAAGEEEADGEALGVVSLQ